MLNSWWILQLMAYILIAEVVDVLFGYVNFRHNSACVLAETAVLYGLLLLCGYLGDWLSFEPVSILRVIVIFLLITAGVQGYFFHMARSRADEINQLLQQEQSK